MTYKEIRLSIAMSVTETRPMQAGSVFDRRLVTINLPSWPLNELRRD
jgi:hypothetical protein